MFAIQAFRFSGKLEEFGQALVEPERIVLQDAVQQRMGEFVAQVLADVVAPEGEDEQVIAAAHAARLRDKKRPPPRQLRVTALHELLVAIAILEQIYLNERVGRG